jgi:YaiO family outer membrane protein
MTLESTTYGRERSRAGRNSARCRTIPQLVATLLALAIGAPAASAQSAPSPWSFDYLREQATVTSSGVDSTWTVDHLQLFWSRPTAGGVLVAAERQRRYGATDVTVIGSAYRRLGDWTIGGDAAATPAADFLYSVKAGGELSYRVVGAFVASGAYHYLQFPVAHLHQAEPSLTWYFARGEAQGRVFLIRNTTADRTTTTTLVRAGIDVTGRLRIDAGAAVGARIFDVASLPTATGRARIIFGDARVRVTAHDFVTGGSTWAHEEPAFSYWSLTVGYRRTF